MLLDRNMIYDLLVGEIEDNKVNVKSIWCGGVDECPGVGEDVFVGSGYVAVSSIGLR